MLGAPVDSRVLGMAGVERPDMKVKLEELDALATEAVNDPTKFGRLLNTAMSNQGVLQANAFRAG